MKLLKMFLIVQVIMIVPLLLSPAKADNSKAFYNLFAPLKSRL